MNVKKTQLEQDATSITALGAHFHEDVRKLLNKCLAETPSGCGGCAHADWVNNRKTFVVGACRMGVKLEHVQVSIPAEDGTTKTWSEAGYLPVSFCTAQNAGIEGR